MPKLRDDEFRMPKSRCPYCDKLLDVASNITDNRGPEPGDWTVCIGCSQFLVYEFDLRLRKPRAGEQEACFSAHPVFKEQMYIMAEVVRSLDRRPRPDRRRLKRNKREHK
jgi:hypothetical protein